MLLSERQTKPLPLQRLILQHPQLRQLQLHLRLMQKHPLPVQLKHLAPSSQETP